MSSDLNKSVGDSAQLRDLVVAHSSDLHLGNAHGGAGDMFVLRQVLTGARAESAHVLLLAGDVFDHSRLKLAFLDEVALELSKAPFDVVILPGNHDSLNPDSVYRNGGIGDADNVTVLGITEGESVAFPEFALSIWGRPHTDGFDMAPLRDPPGRHAKRQIATAHGHWVTGPHDHHRSWLIHDEEVDGLDADYLALGHWDVPRAVGNGNVAAYYSGSPDVARTINVVHFRESEPVAVRRSPLPWDDPELRGDPTGV